jgi:hypothetical protein
MVRITFIFATMLITLGILCYFAAPAGHRSGTAFIPSFDGALIAIGGLIALKASLRMHGMHVAVLFGMMGLFAAVGGLIGRQPHGLALLDMGGMAVLTGIFTVLCVRSFIQARRARRQGQP